jgi:uncharacterized damage-inducible protein DinB
MNTDYFRTLFNYNYWARDRLLAAMLDMGEYDYARGNGFNYRSIRGILTHCVDAEYGWRCRFEGEARTSTITETEVATPALLAERWRQEEAKMRTYLVTLTDEALARRPRVAGRGRQRAPIAKSMAEPRACVNHSTQHRSEAAEALTMVGRSPGELDLGLYARQIRSR